MANVRKKISELTPLTSASLDTTIVGVDNGTTYKIELDTLADAVTSRVNILDRSRLNSLESVTSSFETKGRGILSGSVSYTSLTNIPSGIISQSTDLSSLNAFTASYFTDSASFSSRIDAATNEQSFNGLISGSSQLTSSYDERYVLSGSITQTTWDNIANKPNDIVSSSTQVIEILSSLNSVSASLISKTGSYATTGSNTFIGNQILTGSIYMGTGSIILPNGTEIYDTGDATFNTTGIGLGGNGFKLDFGSNANDWARFIDANNIQMEPTNQFGIIITSAGEYGWFFDANGLSYPDGTIQTTAYPGPIDTGSFITTLSFESYTQSIDSRVDSLETATSSYLTSLDGAISSSSQLTSSLDLRYALSASYLTSLNGAFSSSIQTLGDSGVYSSSAQLPNGLISGSSQLTSSFDVRYTLSGSNVNINTGSFATTGSNAFIGTETISGSLLLSGSFSYNGTPLQNGFAFAQPTLTRILDNASYTGASAWTTSYTGSGGAIIVTVNVSGYRTTGGLGTAQLLRDGVAVASQTFYFNIANYHTPLPPIVYASNSETGSHTYSIYFSNIIADGNDYATINVLEYGNSAILPATLISGSSQLTSSFDTRYAPSASYLTSLNGAFSSSIQTLGGSDVYSSSAQLPSGLISGSSQLTASYDTRYTLSGSISAVPVGTISGSAQITAFGFVSSSTSVPAGTISGSSQLTSSFDARYVQTGSFNSLTASFNSFTASAQSVTTGSNSFNGTQTITGSLIITTGSFVGSQILANTSSLYLTSGSNMYVQNNGVVEITGSLKVSGSANFNVNVLSVDGRSGEEGGEINLAIPVTNTTLENRVQVDIWQNRFRVFEGSANAKGVFVDLSKAPAGVGGELTWKASGYVDAGTFVQLDNIKATVTTSGNRGLSIGAVSTNFTANIGGTFSNSSGAGGNSTQNIAYTTTASTSVFGWNFIAEADTSTYIINDKTNSRMYRITMMIGPAYLGNFISIERLH